MTTPVTKERDLLAQQFDAEVREAEARLKVMQAEAEQRKARQEMDEISGLAATKEQLKRDIAKFRERTAADYSIAKGALQDDVKKFQADITRVHDKYTAWDSARERRFYARLDEAEARLKVWKAKADQKQVHATVKGHDDLARLEEQIALARARAAAVKSEKHSAAAQAAFEDSVRHFDEAYDAATKRYARS